MHTYVRTCTLKPIELFLYSSLCTKKEQQLNLVRMHGAAIVARGMGLLNPGLMITIEKIHEYVDENTLAFEWKLAILVRRLSILTGFCPVSCCYHKLCKPLGSCSHIAPLQVHA